ncbi:unnamed protein product [Cyclocybe aegerita]|uniref:Uncharacterized protein n=1 Tax=Cyclocybe aegerita TaxID=1973307 RepID=A0A8S0WU96_CYCAE|nr:unnamed protein product [Cyclocybe aegerita]
MLLLKKLVIKDIDVLKFVQNQDAGLVNWPGPTPVALWSTGRVGEFRLAFGRPKLNKSPNVGCMPYWATIDPGLNSNGAPIDLLFWNRGVLTYPSAGVSFARKK